MFKEFRVKAALGALAFSASLVAPNAAVAATATGTMAVTATVANSCTVTATTLGFGVYSYVAASTGTATLTVNCTTGTAVASVGLNLGIQPVSTVAQLKSTGTPTIPYALYQDAGYATAWTLIAFPAATTYTAILTAATFTVYGRAPAGANVAAGSYTDSVTITVTYT